MITSVLKCHESCDVLRGPHPGQMLWDAMFGAQCQKGPFWYQKSCGKEIDEESDMEVEIWTKTLIRTAIQVAALEMSRNSSSSSSLIRFRIRVPPSQCAQSGANSGEFGEGMFIKDPLIASASQVAWHIPKVPNMCPFEFEWAQHCVPSVVPRFRYKFRPTFVHETVVRRPLRMSMTSCGRFYLSCRVACIVVGYFQE